VSSLGTWIKADKGTPATGNNHRSERFGSLCKCGARRIDRQIGLERTPDEYLATMVQVFREVKRIMRPDACCFINMGDNFANKQLQEMPSRLVLALQADGWILRSRMPWLKRSAMPESVTDRPASAVEYVFLLTKTARYFYDSDAVRSPLADKTFTTFGTKHRPQGNDAGGNVKSDNWGSSLEVRKPKLNADGAIAGRNMRNSDLFYDSLEMQPEPAPLTRSVRRAKSYDTRASRVFDTPLRTRPDAPGPEPLGLICSDDGSPLALDVNPAAWSQAHFATFPPKLVEPLIKCSTSERGCCAQCGAPWRRTTEKRVAFTSGSGRAGNKPNGKYAGTEQAESGDYDIRMGPSVSSVTTGWSPGCDHEAACVPCVVLDPFAGAGTTLLVADRLQRDAIGIELSPDYTTMATERVEQDAPLLAWLAEAAQ
jgi:hypothetical protein